MTQNLPMKEGCTEVSLLRVGWSVDFSRPQLGKVIFDLIVSVCYHIAYSVGSLGVGNLFVDSSR